MERAVDVGAGVRDHVDAADLERGSVVVVAGRTLALPEIADVRPGQPFVGRHAMLDHMAEVDDPLFFKIRHEANTPIPSHRMLSTADGRARCHQPLTTKPAAPRTFIA